MVSKMNWFFSLFFNMLLQAVIYQSYCHSLFFLISFNTKDLLEISSSYPVLNTYQFIIVTRVYISIEGTAIRIKAFFSASFAVCLSCFFSENLQMLHC